MYRASFGRWTQTAPFPPLPAEATVGLVISVEEKGLNSCPGPRDATQADVEFECWVRGGAFWLPCGWTTSGMNQSHYQIWDLSKNDWPLESSLANIKINTQFIPLDAHQLPKWLLKRWPRRGHTHHFVESNLVESIISKNNDDNLVENE